MRFLMSFLLKTQNFHLWDSIIGDRVAWSRRRGRRSGLRRMCRRGRGLGRAAGTLARPLGGRRAFLVLGGAASVWRARRPPGAPDVPVEPWRTILVAPEWLSPAGHWLGPRKGLGKGRGRAGAHEGKAGAAAEPFAGKAAARGRQCHSEYDLLREGPEARVDMSGHAQEISALAREVVTDHVGFQWGSGWSQRAWSQRRRALMLYTHRCFTDISEEAEHVQRAAACVTV